MQNLTFDALVQEWNALRTQNVDQMASQIPGLQNPRALAMSRVSETPQMLTVMFRGFDQALADTERGTPSAKRFLFSWVQKSGGQAQIQRGDPSSLIIRIIKPSPYPLDEPPMESAPPKRTAAVAHIANMRNTYAH